MGRIVTIASQKGGVGKTTTVLNLGFNLSRLGEKVLMVDADPQGGLAIASGLSRKTEVGLVQVVRGDLPADRALHRSRDGLVAALASGVVEPDDALALEDAARASGLGRALEALAGGFDHVLVDTPAGVGAIVAGALNASDGIVVLLRCQNIHIKSLPILLKLVDQTRRGANPRLRMVGALLAMRDGRSSVEQQICQEIDGLVPDALRFQTVIPWHEAYETASLYAAPVVNLRGPGRTEVARPYLELALEFQEREAALEQPKEHDEQIEGLF